MNSVSTHATLYCLEIKISSETQLSQYIAEVVLGIFLSGARMEKMTAKRSLLKIACLLTESFRASSDRIYNLTFLVFFPLLLLLLLFFFETCLLIVQIIIAK